MILGVQGSSSGQVSWKTCSSGLSEAQTVLPNETVPHPGALETSQISPKPHTRCSSPKLDVATASENLFNQPVVSSLRVH